MCLFLKLSSPPSYRISLSSRAFVLLSRPSNLFLFKRVYVFSSKRPRGDFAPRVTFRSSHVGLNVPLFVSCEGSLRHISRTLLLLLITSVQKILFFSPLLFDPIPNSPPDNFSLYCGILPRVPSLNLPPLVPGFPLSLFPFFSPPCSGSIWTILSFVWRLLWPSVEFPVSLLVFSRAW